jgi:DtxR family Mn-dependent transcriptional regulator
MKMNEKQEEILEAVWTTAEHKHYSIEAILKNCAVDFDEADIDVLEKEGMLIKSKDKVLFSSEGKIVAEGIIRRHRLAEVLVTSILKLKHAEMEEIACQVEHSLHPEVATAICTLLGHPEICPDGKPIPKGPCCTKNLTELSNSVVSLTSLQPGEKGKITYIKPSTHSNLHQLISFGLTPGVIIVVHRKKPAFCIKFENTELAMDESTAKNIFVWKIEE